MPIGIKKLLFLKGGRQAIAGLRIYTGSYDYASVGVEDAAF